MLTASLDMLEESLIKKIEVLKDIEEENRKQSEILKTPEEVDAEGFDATVDKKGELIDKLNDLDEGFQTLFDEVKAEIEVNRELHRDQIKRMQDMVHEIMDRSTSIKAQEYRNKRLAETYFSTVRQKLGNSKKSSAVAFNYYQTMSKSKDIPPQFLDKKN